MVHRWGIKLRRLDFYAPNARYHLKGQKKEKSLSHIILVLKKWCTIEEQNWQD